MKMKSLGKGLFGVLALALLAGCTPHTHDIYLTHPAHWHNYKCAVHDVHLPSSYHTMGWAVTEHQARLNGLAKCRAHSLQPATCHVVHCHVAR
ncbi:hypothetical protein [Coxiella burnetii]|uniref:hypothetical protein n=1 Tax=Coxiella burnetii TaxID=777 RepID=UPI000183D0CB|nr:hypothetical protein [Coxiella burnetii]ACJ18374.1 lipoprotein [Coxiella burnetii CbuG_Q212]ATN66750.1 hypothetical protein AYM17_04935 [Coxiella burnetii]OYK86077.1 hypothetical protein CbuQ229_05160 [Coxiella burnetii]